MSSPEFALLYRVQAQGIDQLDRLTASQRKVNLESTYGKEALAKFDAQLKALTSSGASVRDSLNIMAGMNNQIAKDVLYNDKLQRDSSKLTAQQASESARQIVAAKREEAAASRDAAIAAKESLRVEAESGRRRVAEDIQGIRSQGGGEAIQSAREYAEAKRIESALAREAADAARTEAQIRIEASRQAAREAMAAATEASTVTEAAAREEASVVAKAKVEEAAAARAAAREAVAEAREKALAAREAARAAEVAAQNEARVVAAAQREERREFAETNAAHRRLSNQLKSANVLAGVHDARALDSIIGGLGGGLAIGGLVAAGTVGLVTNLAKNAAESTRELSNLAAELNISTNDALRLSAAATLTGTNINTLSQAARVLAVALEEPGGAGKRTAEAITRLGVSLTDASGKARQDLGNVLQEVVRRLSELPPSSDAARDAVETLARSGIRLQPLVQNFKEATAKVDALGLSISKLDEQRLDRLYERFKGLGLLAEETGRKIAASMEGAIEGIQEHPTRTQLLGLLGGPAAIFGVSSASATAEAVNERAVPASLERANAAARARLRPGAPSEEGDVTALRALLNDTSGKAGKRDQLEDVRKQLADAEERARNLVQLADLHKQNPAQYEGPKPGQIEAERAEVDRLRKEYDKLSQSKKAATDPERTFDRRNLEQENRLLSLRLSPDERQIAQLEGQRQLFQFDLARDKNLTPQQRASLSRQNERIFSQEAIEATRNIVERRREKQFGTDQTVLDQSLDEQERRARKALGFARLQSAEPTGDPHLVNLAFQARKDAADRRVIGTIQNINRDFAGKDADTVAKRKLEQERAVYEYIKEQDEARIERDLALAEIQRRRQDAEKNATRAIARIDDRARVDALQQRFGRQERLDELNTEGRPDVGLIERSLQRRLALAREIHAVQQRDNEAQAQEEGNTIEALARKRIADAQAYRDFEHETNQARMDAETRLAELRKQSLEEAKEGAGQLYDAIRHGSTGDFFRQQFDLVGRNAFSNVVGPILQNVMGSMTKNLPHGGVFQDVFRGTIFDAKDPVAATNKNTSALDDNTRALREFGQQDESTGNQMPVAPTTDAKKTPGHLPALSSINHTLARFIPGLGSIESAIGKVGQKSVFGMPSLEADEKEPVVPIFPPVASEKIAKPESNSLLLRSYSDLVNSNADLKASIDALTVAFGGTPVSGSSSTSTSAIPAATRRTDELASAQPLREIVQSVAPQREAPSSAPMSPGFPAFSGLLASLRPLESAALRSTAPQSPIRTIAGTVSQATPIVRQIGQLIHRPQVESIQPQQVGRVTQPIVLPQPQTRQPQIVRASTSATPRIDLSPITANTQATIANTQALQANTAALLQKPENCGCDSGSSSSSSSSSLPKISRPNIPVIPRGGPIGTAQSSISYGGIPDVTSSINFGGEVGGIINSLGTLFGGDSTSGTPTSISSVTSSIDYGSLGSDPSNGMSEAITQYFGGSTVNPSDPATWMRDANTGFPVPPSYESYPSGRSGHSIFGSGGTLPPSGLQKGLAVASNLINSIFPGSDALGSFGGGGGFDLGGLFGNSGGIPSVSSTISYGGLGGDPSNGLGGLTSLLGGGSGGGMLGQAGSDSVMSEFGITADDLGKLSGPSAGPDAEMPGLSFGKGGAGISPIGAALSGYSAFREFSGFAKHGDARSLSGGIGDAMMTAGMLDPEPISKAVLLIGGTVAKIVSGFFGDPRAEYAKKETRQIADAQQAAFPYTQPGLAIDMSTNGRVVTSDFRGNVQELNAIPVVGTETRAAGFDPLHPKNLVASSIRTVNEQTPTGLVDLFHPESTTGSAANYIPSTASYAMPSPASYAAESSAPSITSGDVNIHLPISAMDSQDVMRRSKDIATAVQMAILNSNHPLARSILDRVNPR